MTKTHFTVLTAALFGLCAGPALAGAAADSAAPASSVAGQKLDSGLDDLPHYRLWADASGRAPLARRVTGESLDNGLGELPHFSQWRDPSGRNPLGREAQRVAGGLR